MLFHCLKKISRTGLPKESGKPVGPGVKLLGLTFTSQAPTHLPSMLKQPPTETCQAEIRARCHQHFEQMAV